MISHRITAYFTRSLTLLVVTTCVLGASSENDSPRWRNASDPDVAEAVADAKNSLQILVQNLSTALTNAVEQGGPRQGIATCQLQALPLTQQSTLDSPSRVTGIKRTSLKLRNPANAPDRAEQVALNHVALMIADGEFPPALLVQEIPATRNHAGEIRIYKPLTVATQCLACHGDPATFSSELTATLAQRYPHDAAQGYAEGDWRGLIRVSLQP